MERYKYKALARFKLMTCRFVANALTHCATLLGNNFLKENNYNIILHILFIAVGPYKKFVTVGSCPNKVKGRENMERIRIFKEIRYTCRLEYACKSWNLIEDHGTLLAYRHSGILVNTEPNQYSVKDRHNPEIHLKDLYLRLITHKHTIMKYKPGSPFLSEKNSVKSKTFT